MTMIKAKEKKQQHKTWFGPIEQFNLWRTLPLDKLKLPLFPLHRSLELLR
jgi:hypothetical protein